MFSLRVPEAQLETAKAIAEEWSKGGQRYNMGDVLRTIISRGLKAGRKSKGGRTLTLAPKPKK